MEDNGLTLTSIESSFKQYSAPADYRKFITENMKKNSLAVVYLDYKVLIGIYNGAKFNFYKNESFEDKYIQRIRVFNENEEFYAWRTADGLKGRLRLDENAAKDDKKVIDVVDAFQVLFGTDVEKFKDFTKIFEIKRGTALVLPFENIAVDDVRKRVSLKIRNYIDYNQQNQATYVDCRFVGFSIDQKTLLEIKEAENER